jgi:hypothetical protein
MAAAVFRLRALRFTTTTTTALRFTTARVWQSRWAALVDTVRPHITEISPTEVLLLCCYYYCYYYGSGSCQTETETPA